MVMEVIAYDSGDAIALAYLLCKNIEKELLMLRESLRK